MLAIVVVGGAYEPPKRLAEWRQRAGLVVAADGGARHALAMGLKLDLVVGDFDSLLPAEREQLQALGASFEVYRCDKDETDAELAIRAALARGADEVVILCALGGRADHALANVFLLAVPDLQERAILASGDTEVRLVSTEACFIGARGDSLSLLPFGTDVSSIWTDGLAYPLKGETLPLGYARGVSNVFIGREARVRIGDGRLLAIHIRMNRGGVTPSC
ncbi:MAG: thiamine diphosphokinase [Anaerolineae bacterium]